MHFTDYLIEEYLGESKVDQQRLIDFAGEKLAKLFMDNRKNYKSPENDIYYWLKKTPKDLEDFINNHKTKNQREKTELEQICEMPEANDVDKISEINGYAIYKINTPEASVKYGLVVGGKAGWCISGGYYDGKNDGGILGEARKYFNDYLRSRYSAYYFVIGNGTKYAVCVIKKDNDFDIWNQQDREVEEIPNLSYEQLCPAIGIEAPTEEYLYDGNGMNVKIRHLIKKVIVKNGVTSIERSAFTGCTSLQEIKIPDSVTSIGASAFDKCENLPEIKIPGSVISIGNYAFYNCIRLPKIKIPGGVTSIGDGAFANCRGLSEIKIPDGVTSIGKYAFAGCESLPEIKIPENVTSIEEGTFNGCSNLTSATIPDSVTSIGNNAFTVCEELTDIIYEGTKEQWDNINKKNNCFPKNQDITVHCKDGNITITIW